MRKDGAKRHRLLTKLTNFNSSLRNSRSSQRCLIDTVAEVQKSQGIWESWEEQGRIKVRTRYPRPPSPPPRLSLTHNLLPPPSPLAQAIMSTLPSTPFPASSLPQPSPKPLPYTHVQVAASPSNPSPTSTPYSISSLPASFTTYLYTSWAFPDVPFTKQDSATLTAMEVGVGLRHDMGKLAWEVRRLERSDGSIPPTTIYLRPHSA